MGELLVRVRINNGLPHFCARALLLSFVCCLDGKAAAVSQPRSIPRPLASHPGNVFVAGESVIISAPSAQGDHWKLVDYEKKPVVAGQLENSRVKLGVLPVGYYELLQETSSATNRTTIGVLEPLRAPTPTNSPIAIDVAMAWFFQKDKMPEVASLCQLAGINRVRDRLLWPELEPKRGQFVPQTRYDASAEAQTAAGLQVLQVGHASAPWANTNMSHFPPDLRDIYNFYREMARRWKDQVVAFEPWNEADIKMFGGHTGSEMATLQKAAYFGLKAGNPNVIACLNVFAIRRASTLADFNDNQAWPYFDTFNLHHYEPLQNYPALYADFRAVCAGKPLWTTECSVRVKWTGDEKLKELSDEDLRLQSERVTKTYALALHQGAANVFYFMLPHYSEGQVQFGVLHADLTPRPGYLAVAAAGRLLAGAKPLGRLDLENKSGQAYFFGAEVDGKPADVAVAWSKEDTYLELPKKPVACYDHLGRLQPIGGSTLRIGRAPTYAILPPGSYPDLHPPPKAAKLLSGKPSPIVLQALFPEEAILVDKSAYKMPTQTKKTNSIFIYNFGSERASGTLRIEAPVRWAAAFPTTVDLGPNVRKELPLVLDNKRDQTWTNAAIRITGDFSAAGTALLSFQLAPD